MSHTHREARALTIVGMSHVTRTHESYEEVLHHTSERAMGWLRLVGSLKLWVSAAEYRLFYRALLQNKPIFLRSLLIMATPHVTQTNEPCHILK